MALTKIGGRVIPGLGRVKIDDKFGTVFITSGTGVIGYRVALSLLDAGVKSVRVGIWSGDRQTGAGVVALRKKTFADEIADILEAKGAEVIDFDWSDEDSFNDALKNVKTVFCTIPHMEDWAQVFPRFLRKSKDANVEHFIKVSFLRNMEVAEKYRQNVPFVRFHSTCDDILEKSASDSQFYYTILGCSHLMSTPLINQGTQIKEQRRFVTASYGMGVNYVSPNDVADAAVVVLLNLREHRNMTYNLTGGQAIYDEDIVKIISKKMGVHIEHVRLGYHEYKRDVKARGLPLWLVRDSAEFERMKASGIDEAGSSYTMDLENLIGRRSENFEDYVNNTSTMRPGMALTPP